MESLMDPSIRAGLSTLVVLKIVLGIDSLVFIATLADELSPKQHNKTRLLGLSLALIMRLGLLSPISWMIMLTRPLFIIMDFSFSGRDLIMSFGGVFLLFKATTELHERLESRDHDFGHGKGYASLRVVVIQIIVLDAVFSLDAIITAVGMVNHLSVMMATVVIAMTVMLLASRPLARFVNQHPTMAMFCLNFLLMIGLSLVAEGFGFHIPKGYLYVAISFSIIIEVSNQIVCCNFTHHQSILPPQAHIVDAILRLMGEKRQANVRHGVDNPMSMLIPEGAFTEEKRYMISGVLMLASRSLCGTMTPRNEISWVDTNPGVGEIHEQLFSPPRSLFLICRGELNEIIGIVRAKELLVALEEDVDVTAIASASPVIIVLGTLDPINPLDVLCRARGSFVIVTNEFGAVQGLVTPPGILEATAGEFPNVDGMPEITTSDDGWLVKGGTSLHTLQQALDAEHLADDDDIATVAGLAISADDHTSRADDVTDVGPLHITIIEANDYHVDLVHTVKEQPAHDEDEQALA